MPIASDAFCECFLVKVLKVNCKYPYLCFSSCVRNIFLCISAQRDGGRGKDRERGWVGCNVARDSVFVYFICLCDLRLFSMQGRGFVRHVFTSYLFISRAGQRFLCPFAVTNNLLWVPDWRVLPLKSLSLILSVLLLHGYIDAGTQTKYEHYKNESTFQ